MITLDFVCQNCTWSAQAEAEELPLKFFSSGVHPTKPDHDVWLEIIEEAHQR